MLLKTDVLEEDKVLQEYFEGVPFCWEKIFHSYFFFVFVLGVSSFTVIVLWIAELISYLFYFECKKQLSFEEHLSIIASDTEYRIIHMLLTIK